MTPAEAQRLPDSGEGLAGRLLDAGREARGLEELYDLAKTKRYAHARVRRLPSGPFWAWRRPAARRRSPTSGCWASPDGAGRCCGRWAAAAGSPSSPSPPTPGTSPRRPGASSPWRTAAPSLYGLCFPEPWTGAPEWTTSPVFLP